MNAPRRFALAFLLVTATAGLCVVDAATYEQRWPYPTAEEVATDYERVVGERTLLFGTVRDVDRSSPTVEVPTDHGDVLLAVEGTGGLDDGPRPGATVQVLGRLEADATIDTERVVVVSPTAGAERFKWLVSLGAVLLFGWLFRREWHVDLRRLRVEAREDG